MGVSIRLNGRMQEVEPGTSVSRLLEQVGVAPERVVVEWNREILPKERFAEVVLEAGDEVELIRFVGGG